jgi:hypothetical protein
MAVDSKETGKLKWKIKRRNEEDIESEKEDQDEKRGGGELRVIQEASIAAPI